MEIIFKDDNRIYYIRNNYLHWGSTERFLDKDLTNIPHLDDTEILCHYIDINNNRRYPVYYEYEDRFIAYFHGYIVFNNSKDFIKDFTLTNLKLLTEK